MSARGFSAIGVSHAKHAVNIGTLWRTAHAFGCAFIFTVGARYRRQASDTTCASRHVPLLHFATVDDLIEHLPHSCPLVGVELDARSIALPAFTHTPTAAYLLGAEDHGLTTMERERCHRLVTIPGFARCLNVATAGSIVLYDRMVKGPGNVREKEIAA